MNHLRRDGRLAAFASLAMLLAASIAHGAEEDEAHSSIDCGPSALYNLAKVVGHPLGLDEIRAHLPAARRGNFSMEELSRSALACGLRLQGVLLAKGEERAIDRPMLVFLNRGEHGHFVVVRPLGTTGKLAQVIDSANPPSVVDKSNLLDAKSWTGLTLIVDESSPWIVAVRFVAWTGLAFGVITLVLRRARLRRGFFSHARRPGVSRLI